MITGLPRIFHRARYRPRCQIRPPPAGARTIGGMFRAGRLLREGRIRERGRAGSPAGP